MGSRVGIVGYGVYVPRHRIRLEEIAKVWGMDAPTYKRGLGLQEKAVAAPDQDTISMSVEAARDALRRADVEGSRIGAVYVGSESHPYAVKPSGTVVAEALGATPDCHVADLEFACNAGAEALFICRQAVAAGDIEYALAVGADTSQGAPGDPLEFATAAGAVALLVGAGDLLASIDAAVAFTTDTPDFWRREHMDFPRHGGRFTGEPAYFRHVTSAARAVMDKAGVAVGDLRFAIFHQPNGKFPDRVAKSLGFSKEQYEPCLLSPRVGNLYSGSSVLGLCAALDVAEPGDRILLASYGSGAGSDGFILTAQERLPAVRGRGRSVADFLDGPKTYIEYGQYARFRQKFKRHE